MADNIVHALFPQDHILEFRSLPVLAFLSTKHVKHMRETAEGLRTHRLPLSTPRPRVMKEWARDLYLPAAVMDPGLVAWWLEFDPEEDESPSFPAAMGSAEAFATFLEDFITAVDTEPITALVIGGKIRSSTTMRNAIGALLAWCDAFPNLQSLFFGEIDDDRMTIVGQTNITPLLKAFPALKELNICVPLGLEIMPFRHTKLKQLVLYTEALTPEITEAIAACDVPALENIELWDSIMFYGS